MLCKGQPMSLKEARRIVKRLRREETPAAELRITQSRETCLLHNPAHHKMAGNYVVVMLTGDHNGNVSRYVWE